MLVFFNWLLLTDPPYSPKNPEMHAVNRPLGWQPGRGRRQAFFCMDFFHLESIHSQSYQEWYPKVWRQEGHTGDQTLNAFPGLFMVAFLYSIRKEFRELPRKPCYSHTGVYPGVCQFIFLKGRRGYSGSVYTTSFVTTYKLQDRTWKGGVR